MLASALAMATIPAEDVDRGTKFYTQMLGLKKLDGQPSRFSVFEAGQGSRILMYQRDRTKAEHTEITFLVDDVEAEVEKLSDKGVKMERYNTGEIKTNEKGIADMNGRQMAWLKDTEGNILGLSTK